MLLPTRQGVVARRAAAAFRLASRAPCPDPLAPRFPAGARLLKQPKASRKKCREIAVQVLFCRHFSKLDMAGAGASVELTHLDEDLASSIRSLEEARAQFDQAITALHTTRRVMAELAKPPEDRKVVKNPGDLLEARVMAGDAKRRAVDTVRKAFQHVESLDPIFDNDSFLYRLLRTYERDEERIESTLDAALVGWSLRRLTPQDGAVLRLGVAELLFFKEIDPPTIINEYIELSRAFSEEEATKIVNAVLDRVAKEVRQ